MGVIKNIEALGSLNELELQKLEAGAAMHMQYSRIEFKVLEVNENDITVRVTQGESPAGNYLTSKELVNRAKDLFSFYLPGKTIHVRAFPYSVPKVEAVGPEWIQKQMHSKGVSQKTIVEETGIDKTNVSAWITGKRPMSQPVKAMFWFMLR
jgi:hypothetical protein